MNHTANATEILAGLSKRKKKIAPKFLYDKKGSEIFERICKLDEYYPIHSEIEILEKHSNEIARCMGSNAVLIEPGCGACLKARYLLRAMSSPKAYVAIDISENFLKHAADEVQKEFKQIPVYSAPGDYTRKLTLPKELTLTLEKKVIFFPGSTIGNMHPAEARKLLKRFGQLVKRGGGVLIGVDLKKETKVLELAYDDPKGVTAEFNYNLLDRLNREFSANFERRHFDYKARYNKVKGRVEMFLESQITQKISVCGKPFTLSQNELIHTEDSYKYSLVEFEALAKSAGLALRKNWTDRRKFFCIYYLERE